MVFAAFGLNHKTAPLSLREQAALSTSEGQASIHQMIRDHVIHEGFFLSTCNRTELYCLTEDPQQLLSWFAHHHNLKIHQLSPHIYEYHHEEAMRHALRVACGLDSMMVGEPQILGQMKQAYQTAIQSASIHQLKTIFQTVFSACKHVRHQSGIGHNPVSVAYAAVLHIKHFFNALSDCHIFIIGSGETATLVAKYLHQEGARDFTVASRTEKNAEKLSLEFNAKSLTITDIPTHLACADIVISATACPLPFINKSMVEQALFQRNQKPLFFLDLAVPRDIEPDVANLKNVQLYNIDDLHLTIKNGIRERQKAAEQAEKLVDNAVHEFTKWHRSLRANHVISDYRSHMQVLAQQELSRATQKLNQGHCQYHVLNEFCDRLMNKLVHKPTLGLRQAASDNRDELLDLAHYLFKTSQELSKNEEIA